MENRVDLLESAAAVASGIAAAICYGAPFIAMMMIAM